MFTSSAFRKRFREDTSFRLSVIEEHKTSRNIDMARKYSVSAGTIQHILGRKTAKVFRRFDRKKINPDWIPIMEQTGISLTDMYKLTVDYALSEIRAGKVINGKFTPAEVYCCNKCLSTAHCSYGIEL